MYEQGASHGRRLLARLLQRRRLTARRAAAIIGVYTLGITVIGAGLARLVDSHDFRNFGAAVWWALQTVSTVGYGDIVPTNAPGRIVGGLLMVTGIAFLAVVTASVTAALIETARRQSGARMSDLSEEIAARLASVEAGLERLEAALRPDRD